MLHPETVIGRNCTIRHEVMIGSRRREHDVPVLGDDVKIGVGAKVLGKIRIGNRVSIGANAVVLDDVPNDHVAVGVPVRSPPQAHGRKGRPPVTILTLDYVSRAAMFAGRPPNHA